MSFIEYGLLAAGGVAAWQSPQIMRMLSGALQEYTGMNPLSDIDVETSMILTLGKDAGNRKQEFLVARDGSLGFMLEINGSLEYSGDDSWMGSLNKLSGVFSSIFSNDGVILHATFSRDPDRAERMSRMAHAPMAATARRLNMDMDILINDKAHTLARSIEDERQHWVVWITPRYLSKFIARRAKKARSQRLSVYPQGEDTQRLSTAMNELKNGALGTFKSVTSALALAQIGYKVLSSADAVRVMRDTLSPSMAGNFVPVLPTRVRNRPKADDPTKMESYVDDTPLPRKMRPSMEDGSSLPGDVLWPSIAAQVLSETPEVPTPNTVRIGGMDNALIGVRLLPNDYHSINGLIKKMSAERVPWRISVRITGNGPSIMQWKDTLSRLLSFDPTSPDNKQIIRSSEVVNERLIKGLKQVQVSVDLVTWAPANITGSADSPAGDSDLMTRIETIVSAYQEMGEAQLERRSNRALRGFYETIPGLVLEGTGNRSCLSIKEALSLLPMQRPASPWVAGLASLFYRSEDNKILPYQPGSKLQNAQVTSLSGPMGYGKSNWISAYLLSALLLPGETEWPRMAVLETGSSSSGFISMVRHALPRGMQDMAVYIKLDRDADRYGINPFDLPMGCWEPLPAHEVFLTNLFSLLAPRCHDGEGFFRLVIKKAYKSLAPIVAGGHPKAYSQGMSATLDDTIKEYQNSPYIKDNPWPAPEGSMPSWWMLQDWFFRFYLLMKDQEALGFAEQCMRFAVPTIADITGLPLDPEIARIYENVSVSETGETLPRYVSRMLQEAISNYPHICTTTKLSIGRARIIGMDLDRVCPSAESPAAKRETAIMTMVARQVAIGSWKVAPEHADMIRQGYDGKGQEYPMAKEWQNYQQRQFQKTKDTRKIFVWDEYHRTSDQPSIRMQVETDIREGRKYEIWIVLASQAIDDFLTETPSGKERKTLLALSSTIIILGAGSADGAKSVSRLMSFSDDIRDKVEGLQKAGANGANMIACYATSKGRFVQHQFLNLGGIELWAYSTDPFDRQLRDRMYNAVGVNKTLAMLGARYPSGCAEEVERRKQAMGSTNDKATDEEADTGIIAEMAKELLG